MSALIRQPGRPCGLTPQKEKILLDAIQRALSYKQASALAGISYMTLNRWRKKGSEPGAPPEFSDFCDRLATAEAKAADALCRAISKAARSGHWQAAAWMLERRYPEDWGRRESLPAPPEPPPPVSETVTPEQMEAMTVRLVKSLADRGLLAKHGYFKAPVPPGESTADVATVSKPKLYPAVCS